MTKSHKMGMDSTTINERYTGAAAPKMPARRKSIFDGLLRIPNFLQKFGIHSLLNAQGNPDGSPAHTPSLRNLEKTGFIDSLMLLPGRSCHQSALRNRLVTEEEFGRRCADFEHSQTSTSAVSCDQPERKPGGRAVFRISARIPLPTRFFLASLGRATFSPGEGFGGHFELVLLLEIAYSLFPIARE